MHQRVVWYPQPDRAPFRVLQALGHLARRRENEGIRTWRHGLNEPVGPVVDARVNADFREVAAHEGEVMLFVRLADPVNPADSPCIANVATKGITRVRRVRNQPTATDGLHNRRDPPRLRVARMNFDQSGHARIVGERPLFAYPENGTIGLLRMAVFYPFGLLCRCFFAGAPVAMQLFVDYLPILFFFGAYFYKDIYFATAVLMVVMPIVFAIQWAITRKVNKIYLASTLLVLFLGGLTIFLHDPLFLYWKPTVLNWIIALVFLGSQFVGSKPIVQRMLGGAATLDDTQWRRLNVLWVGFFATVGFINLYVAYTFSEPTWVKFKLFGMLGLTVVFVIIQTIWLSMMMDKTSTVEQDNET